MCLYISYAGNHKTENEVTVDLLPVFFLSALTSSSLLYRVVREVCSEVKNNWK